MTEQTKSGGGVSVPIAKVPSEVPLSPTTSMDLSWLPESERKALLVDYAKGMLDISKKAQELHVDVGTLENTLHALAATTKEVSEAGNSVTVTHTQTTKIGRTEISMGNTETAKSGRLSSSQTGQRDWTVVYILAGIVAVILVVALVGR